MRTSYLKYLWPAPAGLLCLLTGIAVENFGGRRMFLEVHVPLELGFTVCVFAAIIYSLRLIGKDRARAPRWVMMLNLVFGPLLLSCLVVGGIIAHIGE